MHVHHDEAILEGSMHSLTRKEVLFQLLENGDDLYGVAIDEFAAIQIKGDTLSPIDCDESKGSYLLQRDEDGGIVETRIVDSYSYRKLAG